MLTISVVYYMIAEVAMAYNLIKHECIALAHHVTPQHDITKYFARWNLQM